MSNLIFPSLPGLMWGIKRTPVWNTIIKKTPSGREFRGRLQSAPLRQYALQYEVLREGGGLEELKVLEGFFNQVAGSWGSFLYRDPDDCRVTDQGFGVGDGVSTQFPLVRTWGGCVETVCELDGVPAITGGAHSVADGVVSFATPPANGALLRWTGSYFWRCRFLHDAAEFSQFLKGLWEAKKIEFVTVKP